jgi:protein arginine kinase
MERIDLTLSQPTHWLNAQGPYSDIVISSRIRLARNVRGFPFLQKIKPEQRRQVIKLVKEAIRQNRLLESVFIMDYSSLTELDLQFFLERHLISREHVTENSERAVAVSPDEAISVMILEEDHLRAQVFRSGFDLQVAWNAMSEIDRLMEDQLHYSFSPNLGYLTACPTNVGTGLRASCMLHLPSLVLTKQVHKVLQALAKLNLAARGLYGEGTQAMGNFFQISNQLTLGQNEQEIIDNLASVIKQVIGHEKEARTFLREKRKSKFEDQIWRAAGTLKTARMMSSAEATQLLSLVQLGIHMGVLRTDLTQKELNLLFLLIQPAHLQKLAKKTLDSSERDVCRADLIRDRLKQLTV